ncbi:uncharacterized protein LOC116130845 isoform X2 [Pistacia vera]|uniref:uncharacterized protein LOC116130845 isoform X2 n=1 Tax=Pistacia vera TaxID=55513 RepID=UPI001263D05F|nr:uncharacterized protein LOC116130845 isoform X2 [Pistacia vera]
MITRRWLDTENGKLKCSIGNGFSGIPWLTEFGLVNKSDPFKETENMTSGGQLSCNYTEFQRFDSFFSKFITVAGEFFLPPERHRFGLVSERSLLQYLEIRDSDSWFATLYLAGCPSCSKIFKEENDLKSILQMNNEIVAELDGDGQDLDIVLPANKPSILLFVDRLSDSSETSRKSKEALHTFRELALHYMIPYQTGWQKQPGEPPVRSNQALGSTSGHPVLKLSPKAQKISLKDKMSIMIIDEGKPVTLDNIAPDLQGNSLHEILEYLIQKKKQAKFSSLAKEAGFHLLSDDFDVKIADALSSLTTASGEGLTTVVDGPDKDQLTQGTSISAVEREENSKGTDVVDDEGKTTSFDTKEQLISEEPDQHLPGHYLTSDKDVKVEEKSSSQVYKLAESPYFQSFRGSFFFCDGNYRFLRALTGGSTIPSLVIVDPSLQQHYVFPKETSFSYSSLDGFLHGFLNGSLLPYRCSESIIQSSREATQPPFVNMDFHEVDSIPRVTTRTFSELVLGLNQSENENASHACNEDVLVLFSGGWCGFCQRMELVVREVYRAITGYMKMLKNGYRNGQKGFSGDNLKNVMFRSPRIYLMDCALNDCSSILKSIAQRDVYPALLLFPAERKDAISYDGDIAVADVIKFIADHGNNSHHLISDKGILWKIAEKEGRRQDLFEGSSPTTTDHEEAPVLKESVHEVILKSETPRRTVKDSQIKSHASKGLLGMMHNVAVGSILIATDKLLNAQPFDNSKILIVKADKKIGFEGLIVNKQIRWESLQKLEEGLEFLKAAPLYFGGPVAKQGMPFVSLTRRVDKNQYPEVLPGVYFLDESATVKAIEELKSGNYSVWEYWFFLGYSSWGWDQLFGEIAAGAWKTGDDSSGNIDWPLS